MSAVCAKPLAFHLHTHCNQDAAMYIFSVPPSNFSDISELICPLISSMAEIGGVTWPSATSNKKACLSCKSSRLSATVRLIVSSESEYVHLSPDCSACAPSNVNSSAQQVCSPCHLEIVQVVGSKDAGARDSRLDHNLAGAAMSSSAALASWIASVLKAPCVVELWSSPRGLREAMCAAFCGSLSCSPTTDSH